MSYLIGAALILGLIVAVCLIIVANKKLTFLNEDDEEVIAEDTNTREPKDPYALIGEVWYPIRFTKNNVPYVERITSKGTAYRQYINKFINTGNITIEYR